MRFGRSPSAWAIGTIALLLVPVLSASGVPHRAGGLPGTSVGPSDSGTPTSVTWDSNLSVGPGLNGTLSLVVQVALPSGEIDAGTHRSVNLTVTAPEFAEVTVRDNGTDFPLPIPALGSLGPFEVPGFNYTYLGVPFHVYAEVTTAIRANCTSAPAVGGCSAGLRWDSSGSQVLDLAAPAGAAPRSSIALALTNISYAVGLNLTARGSLPIIGNLTVPVPLPENVPTLYGNPGNLSSSISVVPGPTISSFRAAPTSVPSGSPAVLTVNASGGSGPLSYRYAGLPAGCGPANLSDLVCTPRAAGTYAISVTVSDPQGESANGSVTLTVSAGGGAPAARGGIPPADLPWLALGIVAAAGIGVLVWRGRRRRSAPPPPEPSGGAT